MGRSFRVADVVFLLDANPVRLNKLLTRPRIRRSLIGGGAKGKTLYFDLGDITRLGFALWLSSAGLRIREVEDAMSHRDSARILSPLATLDAIREEAGKRRFFVTSRPYSARKQSARTAGIHRGRQHLLDVIADQDSVVIPLGARLAELVTRLERKYQI